MERFLGRVYVYGMPQCKTCQRALDFLRFMKINISGFRDVKTDKLTEEEIRKLAEIAGGAEAIFSRRAIMYRALDLDKVDLSDEDMIRHMANEHTFIRRPLIVTDNQKIFAGFHDKRLREFFGIEASEPRRFKTVSVATPA